MMTLEGIRILDLTVFQHGPVATMLLADLGADVVKVEDPERGDPGRGVSKLQPGPVARQIAGNFYFEAFNRNKRSVTLNLKTEAGREAMSRLVQRSDVFVQNQRFGKLAKLGFDYDSLALLNPLLIYAEATGFGPTGPEAAKPAFDILAQARSGMMSRIGEPGSPPIHVRGLADQFAGMTLAYGVMLALLARERTGVGQRVETSLLLSSLFLQGVVIQEYLHYEDLQPKESRLDRGSTNVFHASDDRWFAVSFTQSDRYWHRLVEAIDSPELTNDPRFASQADRVANGHELIALLDSIFATRPCDHWVQLLRDIGAACDPVSSYADLALDPQVLANDYLVDHMSPTGGQVKLAAPPFRLERTPAEIRRPAPEHGQHTEEVLIEIGGYSWEEIEGLRERGAY